MKTALLTAAVLWTAVATSTVAEEAFRLSPRGLMAIADLSSPAISPDGGYVAFRQETASVERNSYDSIWYVQPMDGSSKPVPVSDGGAPLRTIAGVVHVEPPQWSADSIWIYYRALHDGEIQVWRASREGSRVERVTSDPGDVQSFALDGGGSSLHYVAGAPRTLIAQAEQHEYDQGILIDRTVTIGQGLFRSALHNGRAASQRYTTGWMIRQGVDTGIAPRIHVVNLRTMEVSESDEAVPSSGLLQPTAGRTPGPSASSRLAGRKISLSWVGSAQRLSLERDDRQSVLVCDLPECVTGSIPSAAWRADHDEVVFTRRDFDRGTAQSIWAWNPLNDTTRRIATSDGILAGDPDGYASSCAVGASYAVCVEAAAALPPRLERISLDTGERTTLFDPNAGLVPSDLKVEFLSWQEDGEQYTGYLVAPAAAQNGRAPLFITYYTCRGFLRGGLGDEWPLFAMAHEGIAALCVNKPPFDVFDQNALSTYQVALKGVQSAVQLLADRDVIDPTRVGMGGLSFGSEVVSWVASHSDLLTAASVASIPSMTPTHYWFHALDPSYRANVQKVWGLGNPDETPEAWENMSAVHRVDEFKVPLLMQMPEQEYLPAVEFLSRMSIAGKAVELYAFPNETHLKYQPRHILAVNERNLDWFRFWLLGEENDDPRKAPQYRRWRAMRDAQETSSGQSH